MSRGLDGATRRELAWRSRTLFERLDADPGDGETDCEAADEFLAAWREAFDGDTDAFERRLAADGATERAARAVACRDRWPGDPPAGVAADVDRLDELVAFVESDDAPTPERDRPYPFAAVVEPWVAFARERLTATAPGADGLAAHLEPWLLERLLAVAAKPLFLEFRTFLSMREPSVLFGDDPEGSEHHDAYVTRLRTADGLTALFDDYPVLARFVSTAIRQWVAAVAEFHGRLDADRERLAAAFADGHLGPVADVEALTDDRHGDGRAVLRVTFASGASVAYKPRPVAAGREFAAFLKWFGGRGDVPAFETPAFLAGDGYGWMGWVDNEGCDDEAAVERFHRRAGALVAVAYVLGLTDVQYENLVAAGEHPVVVDAETVMQPVGAVDDDPRRRLVSEALRTSVLGSRLLPWQSADGPDEDGSGLAAGAVGTLEPMHSPSRWDGLGTDAVELHNGVYEPVTGENRPLLDGEPVDPTEYAGAVVDGFEAAYRRLRADRERLLADDGPLSGFADVATRYLHASTDQYYNVLRAVTSPSPMADGLGVTERTEKLVAHRFADGVPDESTRRLYHRERIAVERLDVPRFETTPTERAVRHDGVRIDDAVAGTGFERVRDRLDDLSAADRATQVAYVRLALDDAPVLADPAAVDEYVADAPGDVLDDWTRRIFDDVVSRARTDDDGRPAWLLREAYDDEAPMTIHTLDDGLYSGQAGLALFFAGLHAVHGDADYRTWALDALAPLRDRLDGDDPFADASIGGTDDGPSAAAYALRTAGRLLDDDALLADARQAARHVTVERIEADETLDVIGGAAGAALSLLAVHEDSGEDWLLDRATAAGDRLLDARVDTDAGLRAWPSGPDGERLTGFSHGAGGIAYALARLADATGADRYAEAAREGFAFEDADYDPDEGNWPDRRGDRVTFMDAWCHGRTGVGLARLAARPYLGEAAVEPGLSRALDARWTDHLGELDNLCCGTAGRVEFLLAAGETLGETAYAAEARELATATVGRAADRGRLSLQSHTGELYDPTLFQGTAGVGYALLRARAPDALPSLLCWE